MRVLVLSSQLYKCHEFRQVVQVRTGLLFGPSLEPFFSVRELVVWSIGKICFSTKTT